MEFYSESNSPEAVACPAGSEWQEEYKEILTKEGKTELKVVDKINIYERTQEAKEGVLLASMLERYKLKINENNLIKIDETITDLTGLPENICDQLNLIDKARLVFEQTPEQIKKIFNNNFNEFLAGAQNGTLTTILNELDPKRVKAPEQPQNSANGLEMAQNKAVAPQVQPQTNQIQEIGGIQNV